eukprot:TRINITY_DN83917_c0_g1_i1.p1 TRINITY_DN83917_c0_g1~~TRINITY_DN83917_c0_g1_i1.p1  ORF type:complete len:514 (-),score=112.47 TRINITY_DN83917_c0_g1_i1:140-1681(-)
MSNGSRAPLWGRSTTPGISTRHAPKKGIGLKNPWMLREIMAKSEAGKRAKPRSKLPEFFSGVLSEETGAMHCMAPEEAAKQSSWKDKKYRESLDSPQMPSISKVEQCLLRDAERMRRKYQGSTEPCAALASYQDAHMPTFGHSRGPHKLCYVARFREDDAEELLALLPPEGMDIPAGLAGAEQTMRPESRMDDWAPAIGPGAPSRRQERDEEEDADELALPPFTARPPRPPSTEPFKTREMMQTPSTAAPTPLPQMPAAAEADMSSSFSSSAAGSPAGSPEPHVYTSDGSRGSRGGGAAPKPLPAQNRPAPRLPTATKGVRRGSMAVKFNASKMQEWFRRLDRGGTRVVEERELVTHLRRDKDMLGLFELVANSAGHFSDEVHLSDLMPSSSSTRTPSKPHADGTPKRPEWLSHEDEDEAEGRLQASRAEVFRIKRLVRSVFEACGNQSGRMTWDEFLTYFKAAGCVLEYHVKTEENAISDDMKPIDDTVKAIRVARALGSYKEPSPTSFGSF